MRLGGVLAIVPAVVLLLAGCGTAGARSTYTPTITVAPSSATSTVSAPSVTTRVTAPATPVGTATPLAAAPDQPAGQCTDLAVTLSAGNGGAGSDDRDVVFRNTGSADCVLRGTPGVSVVGSGNGTQLGAPADRDQDGVATVRIAAGAAAHAPLRIVNIGPDGGPLDDCTVVHGDGYRIYAPHSTRAVFVRDARSVACSGHQVFMTVGPVVKGGGAAR